MPAGPREAGVNCGVHWVFWIQTKLATRCRILVYHVEALTRHAKILAKTRGGLGQSAWNPILPRCGLVPFPPARAVTACSKNGVQIPMHPMTSRRNSLPNPDPLCVTTLPPTVRRLQVPHRLHPCLTSLMKSQQFLIHPCPVHVPVWRRPTPTVHKVRATRGRHSEHWTVYAESPLPRGGLSRVAEEREGPVLG